MSSPIFPKLVLATHNQGKVIELKPHLNGLVDVVSCAADFGLRDVDETEKTFAGNARLKAEYVAKETGHIALADDSGFCVHALNDFPGIYSARWADNGFGERDFKMAMEKVYSKVDGNVDQGCYFISVLALAFPDNRETAFFEGRVYGQIAWPPRGGEGFGYDPMFQPEGFDITFGEMAPKEKQKVSHRAIALNKFIQFLKNA